MGILGMSLHNWLISKLLTGQLTIIRLEELPGGMLLQDIAVASTNFIIGLTLEGEVIRFERGEWGRPLSSKGFRDIGMGL